MPESELFKEVSSLRTERINPRTIKIDEASTVEILEMISAEDALVQPAVYAEKEHIAKAVDIITQAFQSGGRLIYFGAGTSGRLGIVDASECPPTFGSPHEMVRGMIAGGREAVFEAQEGAEDLPENGAKDVEKLNISPPDVVCGIAASGRTPYVRGAIDEARRRGSKTILVSTSSRDHIEKLGIKCDVVISPDVGPEVIAGSTRMKSGTAQKLVLNMLTTASMIKIGKTYGNIMVDLQLTNKKLKERARRILMEISGVSYDNAGKYLDKANGHVKTALVMILADVDYQVAAKLLEKSNGKIKEAIRSGK